VVLGWRLVRGVEYRVFIETCGHLISTLANSVLADRDWVAEQVVR
jgi:hypothetical protein